MRTSVPSDRAASGESIFPDPIREDKGGNTIKIMFEKKMTQHSEFSHTVFLPL
jgi:hypothetical protein